MAPATPQSETGPGEPPRVLLTIDTELTWRPGGNWGDWREAFDRSYEAAGVGVRYQLRVLAQHALKACFFVDPMPACVYGLDPVRWMLEPILEAGQEVQLHLHPLWVGAREGRTRSERQLARYDIGSQIDLIRRARDMLMEAGAPEPIAFRAGNYSANDDTLRALAMLGFRFDSSHNGHQHPWPSAIGLPRDQIAPIERLGMIEIPVSLIADGQSSRHLQICAVSLGEIKAAIEHAAISEAPVVTIVTHSFELADRAGTAPNRIHVKRFEALCEWLASERRRFPTAYFTDLDQLPLDRPSVLLPSAGLRRVGRLFEQIWSNKVEERG